jgi:hypothetical protein
MGYNILQGWTGSYGGTGNSGVDPMFVDADGADDIAGTEDDDLRLMPGSPAINGGDPQCGVDQVELCPSHDLDGHARVLCGRVDIGAYESGIGDYNCDETVDLADFANWEDCMMGPMTTSDEATEPRSDEGVVRRRAPAAQIAACAAFDVNGDGDADLADFYLLQHLLVGQ